LSAPGLRDGPKVVPAPGSLTTASGTQISGILEKVATHFTLETGRVSGK